MAQRQDVDDVELTIVINQVAIMAALDLLIEALPKTKNTELAESKKQVQEMLRIRASFTTSMIDNITETDDDNGDTRN